MQSVVLRAYEVWCKHATLTLYPTLVLPRIILTEQKSVRWSFFPVSPLIIV